MVKKIVLSGLMLGLAACGSSSGGGGGGTGTDTGLIQSSKMACNGASCFGGGSLSLMDFEGDIQIQAVTDAVTLYDVFNKQMIPALNSIVAKIETGVKAGGAVSCSDISTNFNGDVTVDSTTFNAKTGTSTQASPAGLFTHATMNKSLAARVSGGANFVQADFNCGAETDASPLVGRVFAMEGTKQLNAWYERGSANHIRILMIARSSGTNYAAWFKTDDGDNYQIILASGSGNVVYTAAGSKTANKINFKDSGAGAATCLNATTGAADTCSYTLPTVTGIPNTLVTGGGEVAWASIGGATLISPTF